MKLRLSRLGKKSSEETRKKQSMARKGLLKGRKYSEEHKRRIGLAKIGDKNPMWKADVTQLHRISLHEWVRKYLPEPELCQSCNKTPPHDLANKTGKYLRDLTDWEYLCRRCHMLSDGRMKNLRQYQSC